MAIKVAIIVLAGVKTPDGLARVVNALKAVKEFQEANDDVKLIFDGAGTEWIHTLSNPGHRYQELFTAVKNKISGACRYCAEAYDVTEEIKAKGISFADEYEGHPSFRALVVEGYRIITF